jgi:ferric-dicitrate binding protein FerR (iron transport regulator)
MLGKQIEPPAALDGLLPPAAAPSAEDIAEDRRRMQQNAAAFVLVVALVVCGAWMIDRLMAYSRTLTCISTGHRACMVIDPRHLPPR